MSAARLLKIGIVGDIAYESSGAFVGPARIAELAARHGARTAIASRISDNEHGKAIVEWLMERGIDASQVEPSPEPRLKMGDRLDVSALFDMDAVLIAASDPRLYRFLVDLPVHTAPNARLAGLLDTLLTGNVSGTLVTLLRLDLLIGQVDDLQRVTASVSEEFNLDWVQAAMTGANLRAAALQARDGRAWIITRNERFQGESSSFEAFAAAALVTFAGRSPWLDVFRLDPTP